MSSHTPRWAVSDADLRRRLGGRWAVSLPGFVIGKFVGIPTLVLTGGAIGAETVAVDEMPVWLGISLLGVAIAGVLVLIADRTVFRNRRAEPVSPWLTVTFYAVIGIVYGANIVGWGIALGLTAQASPPERIGVIAVIVLWWNLTFAWLMSGRDDYRREREARIERAVRIEMAAIADRQVEEALFATISAEVAGPLASVQDRVAEALTTAPEAEIGPETVAQWTDLAASVRQAAEATVRPLSHRLWDEAAARYPEPQTNAVLVRLLRRPQFEPWGSFAIVIVGYLPAAALRFGFLSGLALAVVFASAVAGCLRVANETAARAPRLNRPSYAVAFVVTVVVGAAVAAWLLDPATRSSGEVAVEVLGGVLAMAAALLLPSAVESMARIRREQLQGMDADAEGGLAAQTALARRSSAVARAAARTLHGAVQTRLIACAAGIDFAVAAQDASVLRQALTEAAGVLSQPLPAAQGDIGLREAVAAVVAPWQGLCDVVVHWPDDEEQLRGQLSRRVATVVEEGLANAFRHGGATTVWVWIARDGAFVQVRIVDDGCGPGAAPSGLGSIVLRDVAGDDVHLRAAGPGRGAELVVRMPMGESAVPARPSCESAATGW